MTTPETPVATDTERRYEFQIADLDYSFVAATGEIIAYDVEDDGVQASNVARVEVGRATVPTLAAELGSISWADIEKLTNDELVTFYEEHIDTYRKLASVLDTASSIMRERRAADREKKKAERERELANLTSKNSSPKVDTDKTTP